MIKVLVVDDDFRVARIHSAFIDRVEGFETIAIARTGDEAIRQAITYRPDLILLDLYLPDMFGLDVLNRMRVRGVEGDVIVISAANDAETVERAVKLGVANYLLKPFTQQDLVDRLRSYQASQAASHAGQIADQAAIDQLLSKGEAGRTAPLPKGLSIETAELILHALADQKDLSAQECAEQVGISRVSARRYLEFFTTTGRVSISLRYGSVGRPERRYGLVDAGA